MRSPLSAVPPADHLGIYRVRVPALWCHLFRHRAPLSAGTHDRTMGGCSLSRGVRRLAPGLLTPAHLARSHLVSVRAHRVAANAGSARSPAVISGPIPVADTASAATLCLEIRRR